MKVLAIIVTYKGKQWYERCFGSLLESTIPVDVFVVDNASGDGSVEYIQEHFPQLQLVASEKNLGFGQANNKGFRYALDNGYDYVFLLNQDAWLHKVDAIERLVEVAEQHPEYGIVSPLHLYGSGERLTLGMEHHLMEIVTPENDCYSDALLGHTMHDIYEVNYVCAAAWLLPMRTIQTIGGFDPIFFHYGEDDNYMQRVTYHGLKIGVCPQAAICHDVEFRGGDYGKENDTWQKNLLIELADVNTNAAINIPKQLKNSFIRSLLAGKINHTYSIKEQLKYCKKMKHKVQNSIAINKKGGTRWI